MAIIKTYIALYLFLFLISCRTHPKVEFINSSMDSTIKATRISINKLAKQYKSYHGQYIEIEGIFYAEFENVALCNYRGRNSKCFWLDFTDSLVSDHDLWTKATTKRAIIRGRIDTTSKGHFSYYLATIRNIYYFKEK